MQVTRVVNIKSSQYDVYIGRIGRGEDGYFGNPFPLSHDSPQNRESVLILYEKYFHTRLDKDPEFKRRIHELKGKVLGCFCKPLQCHGDIIIEYLNTLPNDTINKD